MQNIFLAWVYITFINITVTFDAQIVNEMMKIDSIDYVLDKKKYQQTGHDMASAFPHVSRSMDG